MHTIFLSFILLVNLVFLILGCQEIDDHVEKGK